MDDVPLLSFTFYYLYHSSMIHHTFISQTNNLKLKSYRLTQIMTDFISRLIQSKVFFLSFNQPFPEL